MLIIDTGATATKELEPWLRQVDKSEWADSSHGQTVTKLVLAGKDNDWVCKNVKVDVCAIKPPVNGRSKGYYECLDKILFGHYNYVNISLSGDDPDKVEERILADAVKRNINIVVAAGNDGQDISKHHPASLAKNGWKNFHVVTNHPNPKSNYGDNTVNVDDSGIVFSNMRGTSMSAALYTHKLLKGECGRPN